MATPNASAVPFAKPRNQEATLYVSGLDDRVTEYLLYELFLQAGPVNHVSLPKDRVSQTHHGYAFVEMGSEGDAEYAMRIMNGVRLFMRPIRINRDGAVKQKGVDVGANLFIGNLAQEVDERVLQDCFQPFGQLISMPKLARDPETGQSKGYGFVSYDAFEASDAAIEAMDGQYLCNRPIQVNYAFKREGKGERHGSAAERLLAAQGRKTGLLQQALSSQAATGASPTMPQMPTGMPYPGMVPSPGMPHPGMQQYPPNYAAPYPPHYPPYQRQ